VCPSQTTTQRKLLVAVKNSLHYHFEKVVMRLLSEQAPVVVAAIACRTVRRCGLVRPRRCGVLVAAIVVIFLLGIQSRTVRVCPKQEWRWGFAVLCRVR
jgi:hypothetical protein